MFWHKEVEGAILFKSIFFLSSSHFKLLAFLRWQPDLDIHRICGVHWRCKSTNDRFFIISLMYQENAFLFSTTILKVCNISNTNHSHDFYSISDVSSMKERFSFMNLVRFSYLVSLGESEHVTRRLGLGIHNFPFYDASGKTDKFFFYLTISYN